MHVRADRVSAYHLYPVRCRLDAFDLTRDAMYAALRAENRWYHYGDGALENPAKRRLFDAFCPRDYGWREQVLRRGGEVTAQACELAFVPVNSTPHDGQASGSSLKLASRSENMLASAMCSARASAARCGSRGPGSLVMVCPLAR